MALVDSLRRVLNASRAIPGQLGLRPFAVSIVRSVGNGNAWDGPGSGSEVVTELKEADDQNPSVRFLTTKDYVAGYPADTEIEVRITAELVASIESIQVENENLVWIVTGPGMGATGTRFRKTYLNTEKALSWRIGLARIGNGAGLTLDSF